MIESTELIKLKELVEKAQDIMIVTHERPTPDSVGSALALYLGFVNSGKKVTISCPDAMTVELSSFIGVNKISSEVQKKNFVISLDYVEGSIEKVSYNIESNKFNLVIEPRPGFDSFSSDKVQFYNSGANADLIITIDTIHLGGLKKLYENEQNLFNNHPVINIDHHTNNANFGQINLINPSSATTAEIVAKVLSGLGMLLTEDIATNILNAIFITTNNFQSPFVNAETFELVAACYKAGGKRFAKRPADEIAVPENVTSPVSDVQIMGEPKQTDSIVSKPTPAIPFNTGKQYPKPKEAPADWLKPKIFKSTSNI
jgi:nanoRNase/pAp phosphatase (c-di-AMP/oligoRNAs hydrolase)